MILLQAFDTLSEVALQYGVIGILAFLLSIFAWNQFKRQSAKNADLEEKLDTLQQAMLDLVVQERDQFSELIQKNTDAINNLTSTIINYLLRSSNDDAKKNIK